MRESRNTDATPRQQFPASSVNEPTPNPAQPQPPVDAPGDQLLPLIYTELRRLAQRQVAREPAGGIQATTLVHEAYLRLGADPSVRWQGPRHYYGAAAIAMRRILVERARQQAGPARAGGRARLPIEAADAEAASEPGFDWLALDEALSALQVHDAELAELVLLRYFAGLSVDRAAEALGVSPRTIDRNWRVARAFLQHYFNEHAEDSARES